MEDSKPEKVPERSDQDRRSSGVMGELRTKLHDTKLHDLKVSLIHKKYDLDSLIFVACLCSIY